MVSQSKDTLSREIKPMNEASKNQACFLRPGNLVSLGNPMGNAARAGTTTAYFFGQDSAQIHKYANFADKAWFDTGETYANHAQNRRPCQTRSVGSCGHNVAEWTDDAVMRGGSGSLPPSIADRPTEMGDRDQRNYLGVRVVIRRHPPPPPRKVKFLSFLFCPA